MSAGNLDKDVKLTNPMPTPALPPISETQERPHKIWKISASDKESATDRNGKNLHCPSEQTGTKQKLQWQFELGKPLAHPNVTLSPKMAALNDWYLSQKAVQFGAIYQDKRFFPDGNDVLWVQFKELYDFYNVFPLDVQILSLWTMYVSFCPMCVHLIESLYLSNLTFCL